MEELEEGIGEGCSVWFSSEAYCSDGSSDEEEEQQNDSFQSISDFINDIEEPSQGNTQQLFQQQSREESGRQLQALKRKYIQSPPREAEGELSPRLRALSITPERKSSRRRLFVSQADSGVGSERNETADTLACSLEVVGDSAVAVSDAGHVLNLNLLHSQNRLGRLFALFKEGFGVGIKDLTREYKSDKTCNVDWVVAVYSVSEEVVNAARDSIVALCDYTFMLCRPTNSATIVLMLLRFKRGKCRETVRKQISSMLHVDPLLCICDPPKIQSTPAALFWYKSSMGNSSFTSGDPPEWIKRQTLVTCAFEDSKFDLGVMVQWAYDNEYYDESVIAYEYALRAGDDPNANAWLASNAQAKHVKDCATMVRHYKRAEMKTMTMSQWVWKCCKDCKEVGDWKPISMFLRMQGVEIIRFLSAMRHWLKGVPKKNCLAFCGKPNTGKSAFCMSLLHFLKGRVLSYANSKSHFWMQPLTDAKMVLIDDATKPTWDYIDTYLRNALDGNMLCIDCKYRAPAQIKCPPMLITTNEDIFKNDRWKYLHSRVTVFYFDTPMPLDAAGDPHYLFSDRHWKSFFERLQRPLDLSEDEAESNNGEPMHTLKCSARGTDGDL